MDTLDQPSFPVLAVSDGYIRVFQDLAELSTATVGVIKTGYFKKMLCVDFNATSWQVVRADVERFLGPRWALSNMLRSRPAVFTLAFERTPDPASLADLKVVLSNHMRQNAEVWDGAGDLHQLLERVEAADTLGALFAIF